METLNKRERKLFNKIKKEMIKNKTCTIQGENLHIYGSLLKKLKNSDIVYVTYADNCAFLYDVNRIKQYEIEEKETRKENKKISAHDYKVAIVSALVSAILTYIITIATIGN